MRRSVPDETGWYWCKSKHDEWSMAFVNTGTEKVWIFDEGFEPPCWDEYEWDDFPEGIIVAWYGPFYCPGGDFGWVTVGGSEEDYAKAQNEGKVIGIQHFDFKYCRDEGHGSSLTVAGLYTREEAESRIHREVKDATPESA